MKKLLALLLVVSGLMVSCSDDFQYNGEGTKPEVNLGLPEGYGMLSFGEMQISIDESEAMVRSTELPEVGGNYVIKIKDAEGKVVVDCSYKDIKDSSEGIALLAGEYTLEVCSTIEDIPDAAWEQPIYGATMSGIKIEAGKPTIIAEPITCTLLQCKVTVDYNDDFLAMVKGACKTTITIGSSLEYNLNWDATEGKVKSYEKRAGYFDVNNGANTTMEVKFEGSIYDEESESVKTMRQSKAFEGIEARQWRQVRFVKKVNEEGNASFEIEIDGYVEDDNLGTEDMTGEESVLAPDPNAPKGDGDIRLLIVAGLNENTTPTATVWNNSFTHGNPSFDPTKELEEGEKYTDEDTETYPTIVLDDNLTTEEYTDGEGNPATRQLLKFKAEVPQKIKKFYVVIESDVIEPLLPALIGNADKIDLVENTTAVEAIATVLPFPYHDPDNGVIIAGASSVEFDLSPAVKILRSMAAGSGQTQYHTFHMTVVDKEDCTKTISLNFEVIPSTETTE